MRTLVHLLLLAALGYSRTQGQVISEPDDVTVCEGREAVFTCVLNSNISDDVKWYRFIKDTGTTEMLDLGKENFNFTIDPEENDDKNATNSSLVLTITDVIKSYTGYFWVRTPSLNVCNASLTVLTSPPALNVEIMTNIESSSIVLQWDAVNELFTTILIIWYSSPRSFSKHITGDETSFEITELTLDAVYTITARAKNSCGSGKQFSTSITLSASTTSNTFSVKSVIIVSTNPVASMSTVYTSMINPSTISTNSMYPSTTATNSMNPSTTLTSSMNPSTTSNNSMNPSTTLTSSMNPSTTANNSMNPSTTATNSMNPSATSTYSMNPSTTSTYSMITTSIGTVINSVRSTTTAVSNPIITISTDTILLSTSPAKATMGDNNSDSINIPIIAGAAIGGIIVITIVIVLILVIIFCCLQQRKDTEKNNYNDLSGDDTLTKDIPVVLSPLNANEKPETESSHQISTTTEVLYMTSDVGNKKPTPYKRTESAPQNGRKDTQHQQFMEYAEIDIDNKKIEDKQQNGGAGTQHQQPMEYAVVDKSKKKNRKGDKQQNLHYADLEVLPPGTAFVTTDESRTPYALVAET